MKIHRRPEYVLHDQHKQQNYPLLSEQDIRLLQVTRTDEELKRLFVYHPKWAAWRPLSEIPELAPRDFLLNRNIKVPQPTVPAQSPAPKDKKTLQNPFSIKTETPQGATQPTANRSALLGSKSLSSKSAAPNPSPRLESKGPEPTKSQSKETPRPQAEPQPMASRTHEVPQDTSPTQKMTLSQIEISFVIGEPDDHEVEGIDHTQVLARTIQVLNPLFAHFVSQISELDPPFVRLTHPWPPAPDIPSPIEIMVDGQHFSFFGKASAEGYPYRVELLPGETGSSIDEFFSNAQRFFQTRSPST